MFSDRIEAQVPPAKGRAHVLRVVREILTCSPTGRGTDIAAALDVVRQRALRRSVVFLISDFELPDDGGATLAALERAARPVGARHDVVAFEVRDPRERTLPESGPGDRGRRRERRRRHAGHRTAAGARAVRGAGRQARRRDATGVAAPSRRDPAARHRAAVSAGAARLLRVAREEDRVSPPRLGLAGARALLGRRLGSGRRGTARRPSAAIPAPTADLPAQPAGRARRAHRDSRARRMPTGPGHSRHSRSHRHPAAAIALVVRRRGGRRRRRRSRRCVLYARRRRPIAPPHERALRALAEAGTLFGGDPRQFSFAVSEIVRAVRRGGVPRARRPPNDRGAPGRPDAGPEPRRAPPHGAGRVLALLRPRQVCRLVALARRQGGDAGQRRDFRSRHRDAGISGSRSARAAIRGEGIA